MKEDNYYEPLYIYTNSNNKISVSKEFKEFDPNLSKNIKNLFKEIIKPFFTTICKPLASMPPGGLSEPHVYNAKQPLLLYNLIEKLLHYDYDVVKLVLNFNNKVIGVISENQSKVKCFVPCYPSALNITELNENFKKDFDYVLKNNLSL